MTSKFYKSAHGQVYGKCGLTFGAEPVEVPAETLATKRGFLDQTIGERLAQDPILVEVAAPTPVTPAEPPKKGDEESAKIDGKGKEKK